MANLLFFINIVHYMQMRSVNGSLFDMAAASLTHRTPLALNSPFAFTRPATILGL